MTTPKRPRGRPPLVDRPDRVGARLPEKIRARLLRKCEAAGITESEGVRRAVLKWIEDAP